MFQVPECLLNPSQKRRHPIHTGGRSMAGGSLPAQSRAGSKKKIKTILPQKSPDCPAEKSSESESDSEEEEEARVINDYDYEALEDIWLKAGEIEAKDLSFSESRRKDGEKGGESGREPHKPAHLGNDDLNARRC